MTPGHVRGCGAERGYPIFLAEDRQNHRLGGRERAFLEIYMVRPKLTGVRRVARSIRVSSSCFRYAVVEEAAIREALIGLLILLPVAILLPASTIERLLLVLSMMLVVLVEFVNSAIEAVVDRVSLEEHPLAARAKDMANVAVVVAVIMMGLCWPVIAGPVLLELL